MVAKLVVTKSTGEQLFDTSLIAYGLVKSGNMVYIESWTRRELKSAQLDPNDGGNWRESVTTTDGLACPLFGFTVTNCQSPIVFIVGTGCLQGTTRSGNTMTFMYANADNNTKFYCFDLMANNFPGSPFLKTFKNDSTTTFNSMQNPLNVVAAIQAPAAQTSGQVLPYVGGYGFRRSSAAVGGVSTGLYSAADYRVDISVGSGEYAAFLPWSRNAGISDVDSSSYPQYSISEGAYGRIGGISFMFGASGACTQAPGPAIPVATFNSVPTVYPTALVIATAGLPFPFN
jgi:hypothetical protein